MSHAYGMIIQPKGNYFKVVGHNPYGIIAHPSAKVHIFGATLDIQQTGINEEEEEEEQEQEQEQASSCQYCFDSRLIDSGVGMLVTPCGGSNCVPMIRNTEIDVNSVQSTKNYNFNQCGIINSGSRSIRAIQLKVSTGVENTLRPAEYPWLVRLESRPSIQETKVTLCGGTLIHPQWVLTAAHCMFHRKTSQLFPANGVNIYIGHYDRFTTSKDEIVMRPAAYIIHPKFTMSQTRLGPMHDLALIKLQWSVPLSRSIGVACLPERSDKLTDGILAYTAGWGHTSPNSSAVNKPRKTRIKIAPRSCQKLLVDDDLHVCGRNNRGQNICAGDAGSGLMVRARITSDTRATTNWKWYIFGVASYGPAECSQSVNHNNVFSSVVADVDWIREMMQKY